MQKCDLHRDVSWNTSRRVSFLQTYVEEFGDHADVDAHYLL